MINENDYLTIQEASEWATSYLGKKVTPSNISYLIQYGRVQKYGSNGVTRILKKDLIDYYISFNGNRELHWKKELGNDLNWSLSFEDLPEKVRTKHVHRLHPYKGKFIPQLVEYFLDTHVDQFKKEVFFNKGDIILDPFCGSGTTLIQSNELGLNSIGIEISAFNALISNVKLRKHNLAKLMIEINQITMALQKFIEGEKHVVFEKELSTMLVSYNNKFFPSPEYKQRIRRHEINESVYGREKEKEFLKVFNEIVSKNRISYIQEEDDSFLSKWFSKPVRDEIEFVFEKIKNVDDIDVKEILAVILSRTMRSCRATTHADLATLLEPVHSPYYCRKHGKICKPIFSIIGWWKRYCDDTLSRFIEFDRLRTNTQHICLVGDSRIIDIEFELSHKNDQLSELVKTKKINGIFSSPPYVGLIDYHEQHAYAYDLYKFDRQDEFEIGPLFKGQGKEARDKYVADIAEVLLNCRKFMIKDFDVFLVSNDKYGLYPAIAEKADMRIIEEFTRPVLCRTERNKNPYSEKIFHMRRK